MKEGLLHLAKAVLAWSTRPSVMIALVSLSAVSFVASVVGVPWYLRRLPADYFTRRERERHSMPPAERPVLSTVGRVSKNVVGGVLVVAGVAMLVLPGQGIATIAVGMLMLDFPGKKRFERRLLSAKPVLNAVNALRKRAGHEPLIIDERPSEDEVPSAPQSEPRSAR
jgi:UPF0716 family protein affecting phage T7 exclusion